LHCGQTKREKLAQNVLVPYSFEMLLNDLKDKTCLSVANDSSNKGNIKCYPIVIKYFSEKIVLKEVLLSSYKDSDEKANVIF
jgi:hypothetical protein